MTASKVAKLPSQESDGEIDPLKVANLVSLIVEYDNMVVLGSSIGGTLAELYSESTSMKRRELSEAGAIGLRNVDETTLGDSSCNLGAIEYWADLPGAQIIRVYGIRDSNVTYLPSKKDGQFDGFLGSIAREEDEDMIVAVPAEDYHDGYVLYSVFPGGFTKLTEGEPITSEIDLSFHDS